MTKATRTGEYDRDDRLERTESLGTATWARAVAWAGVSGLGAFISTLTLTGLIGITVPQPAAVATVVGVLGGAAYQRYETHRAR